MKRLLMLVANDFEDSEVRQPLNALQQAGFRVDVAGPEAGKVYRGKRGKETVTSNMAIHEVKPDAYDALVLPGGYAPDKLRIVPHAVSLVRRFFDMGRPIAAVCHGPQLLISADVIRGKRVTGYASIVVDLKNAGAHYVDQAVVVDGNLITSRQPDDLPQFSDALIATLKGEKVQA